MKNEKEFKTNAAFRNFYLHFDRNAEIKNIVDNCNVFLKKGRLTEDNLSFKDILEAAEEKKRMIRSNIDLSYVIDVLKNGDESYSNECNIRWNFKNDSLSKQTDIVISWINSLLFD